MTGLAVLAKSSYARHVAILLKYPGHLNARPDLWLCCVYVQPQKLSKVLGRGHNLFLKFCSDPEPLHAEYERRWSICAATVDTAGETYPIWSDMFYAYTLCEHSYESSTVMNSCSKEITAQFL